MFQLYAHSDVTASHVVCVRPNAQLFRLTTMCRPFNCTTATMNSSNTGFMWFVMFTFFIRARITPAAVETAAAAAARVGTEDDYVAVTRDQTCNSTTRRAHNYTSL